MTKKIIVAVLCVVIVCSLAGAGTMAYFQAKVTSTDNRFNTGTLKLAGVGYEDGAFASLSIDNIRPGLPVHETETIIQNTGSLPLKLYKINAKNFGGNVTLDNVLNFEIYIIKDFDTSDPIEHKVYEGTLYDLRTENGGYFEEIYVLKENEQIKLKLIAEMDSQAGNEYQDMQRTCDFILHAAQLEMPLSGDGGERQYLATSESHFDTRYEQLYNESLEVYYDVFGENNNGQVIFDYDWNVEPGEVPVDWIYRDRYVINMKHHTGHSTREVTIITKNNFRYIEVLGENLPDGLDGYIHVNKTEDIVSIEKEFFDNLGWDMFEVQFTGRLRHGDADHNVDYNTEYVRWTLDGLNE